MRGTRKFLLSYFFLIVSSLLLQLVDHMIFGDLPVHLPDWSAKILVLAQNLCGMLTRPFAPHVLGKGK